MTSTIQDHECPLCQKAARFELVNFPERKHFDCGHCTRFVIAELAEGRLANSTLPQRRAEISEKARQCTKKGKRLVITLAPLPQDTSLAYDEFDLKCVSLEELFGAKPK